MWSKRHVHQVSIQFLTKVKAVVWMSVTSVLHYDALKLKIVNDLQFKDFVFQTTQLIIDKDSGRNFVLNISLMAS